MIAEVVEKSKIGKARSTCTLSSECRRGAVAYERASVFLAEVTKIGVVGIAFQRRIWIDLVDIGDAVELHAVVRNVGDLQQRRLCQFLLHIQVPIHYIRSLQVLVDGKQRALAIDTALVAGGGGENGARGAPVDQTSVIGFLEK